MRNQVKLVIAALGSVVLSVSAQAQVLTPAQTVGQISFKEEIKYLYVWTTASTWGAPGCTGATLAIIPDLSVYPHRKTMVAMVMMAKTTGALVRFGGVCAPWDSNVFVVNEVIVQ
jgi:hypothetical protein